jgi:uncharacterized protein YjhX (UPF0386 family)
MQKFDGVIDAVRYKNGKIDMVRAYERRGATFSDYILIDRKTLFERLKKGKRFVTGQRKKFWASTFEVGKPVLLAGQDGKQVMTTRTEAQRDELEGVPSF